MREASVTVIIPARYGSSRFPGKPLARLMGKPMIQHVYERAAAGAGVGTVLVATDDTRIRDTVEGFGGRAILTTEPYRTGTDRASSPPASMSTPGPGPPLGNAHPRWSLGSSRANRCASRIARARRSAM